MLKYSDLKKGENFIFKGQPYEVLDFQQVHRGRGLATVKIKIRNLISGEILEKTCHPSEEFEEADIEEVPIKFLYSHRGKFGFCQVNNPKNHFKLTENIIGEKSLFLKPGQILTGLKFQGKIINIKLPVKVELKIIDTPPSLKGERAQTKTKIAVLETGLKIEVPSFLKVGDVIQVNTETKEYVKRINKE